MTQQYLQQAYSRQSWQLWLQEIFGSQIEFETQAENIDIAKENIKSVQRFASVKLADGKTLAVLDIETRAGIQIARNRVGLRELVIKLIDHANYHGILAFYHSEDTSQKSYRFSFISSEPTIDAEGNFNVQSTAPKRFTYVLGVNEKTKTPADRLKIIAGKHAKATLEDVKNAFSVDTLTKEFYAELSNWYFWALQNVVFPDDQDKLKLKNVEEEKRDKEEKRLTELRNSTSVIRLITRLMFVWFLKQKKLINDELFDTQELDNILNYKDKTGSTFYKAILQNLFFATLNTEMGDNRKFVRRQSGIQEFYRYERFFKNKERFIELTKNTPFLNGGLFENLDKNVGEENEIRIDCFSNRLDKEQLLKVPDFLFFSEEKSIDLNKIYDTKRKDYKVRGLIDILKSYNFTIEENTSTDIEVALDPELLGKVFENLLASFNPETQTTARKQTGSFYTPREIVDYMVNESVSTYLQEKVGDDWENDVQTIPVLHEMKILDPACGSGAFPMGILHKMVQILQKLDPRNELWKQRQLDIAGKIEDFRAREAAIANIEEAFENNELDYGRKLFLIENCIFGIDIQPIAVQIAKLRFFISLICEQTPNPEKPNLGIRPLPNLETKFVAANTLIGLNKPKQKVLGMDIIEPLEKELAEVRHKHFSARTPETKRKYRDKDSELRTQIAGKLKELGFGNDTAEKIALWNPYDQNTHAEWFDSEWMFDIKDGFDIVIGNPPFLLIDNKIYKQLYKDQYLLQSGKIDLYRLFIELSMTKLCKENGVISFITPNTFLTIPSCELLRKHMLNNLTLLSVTNYENRVFDSASVNNVVFVLKNTNKQEYEIRIVNNSTKHYLKKCICLKKTKAEINIFISNEEQSIIEYIMSRGDAIGKHEFIKIALGEQPYHNTIHSVEEIKSKFLHAKTQLNSSYMIELGGKNILRYGLKMQYDNWLNFDADLYTKPDFKFFSKERIILREIVSKQLTATYTDEVFLVNKSCYSIISENSNMNLKFILSILNSKLIGFFVLNIGDKSKQELFPRITMSTLKKIPIPIISLSQQQPFVFLVDKILYLTNKDHTSVSEIVNNEIIASYFEKVLDAVVFELYFEDEIKSHQVDILNFIQQSLNKVSSLPIEQQILHLYEEWNEYKNEVRNRVILQETRSESVAQIIKSING